MPQQNQNHGTVASLKLELVAAIRGAFEVAVEIAVREVTELVGQTTDKYLEVMRIENESLSQRWTRGVSPVVDRGRIELPESRNHLKNNSKPLTEGCSAAGQSTMDPNCVSARRQYLSIKDKVSALHLDEELLMISSDEDTTIGYADGDMAVCAEKIKITPQNTRNNKNTPTHMVNVKHEKIKEENCQIKLEVCSPRRESEEQSSSSSSVVFEEWQNVKGSDTQLSSSRLTDELTVGRPAQAAICNGQMLPMESLIAGSVQPTSEVYIPPSTISSIYNTLGQTINPTSLTQNKRTSPFRCTICHRGFNHLMNLKTHLRIHTGERPYTCPICSRCFRHSNALTRHVRIHTGEKPYNCGWCGKSFRHLAGLKIHQRAHKQ